MGDMQFVVKDNKIFTPCGCVACFMMAGQLVRVGG